MRGILLKVMMLLACMLGAASAWAATYTVSNRADDGATTTVANTLRWAVASSNGNPGQDTIDIVTGSGNSITVLSSLTITGSAYIQGHNAEVIGAYNSAMNVLIFAGGGFNSTLSGLAVVNGLNGVFISSTSGVCIIGCRIGTDWADTPGLGNTVGIRVSSAPGTVIGQPGTPLIRNVISGNGTGIFTTSSSNLLIQNNYIGLKSDGVTSLPNTTYGIRFSTNTWTSRIGGDINAQEGNVISGNGSFGIFLEGASVGGNSICGNIIGLNGGQSSKLPNSYGILVEDSSGNAVGLPQVGYGNYIAGNTQAGIKLQASSVRPRLNVIRNNCIGINAAGNTYVGNSVQGIYLEGDSNLVGGRLQAGWYERNWISGNGQAGIAVLGDGNTLSGNYIGLNITGNAAVPNANDGMDIAGNGNLIGGLNPDASGNQGNLISGNGARGIGFTSGSWNTVLGNWIGVNAAGGAVLANWRGLDVSGAVTALVVGGGLASQRNVISGNGVGLYLAGDSGFTTNTFQGNYIGVSADGTTTLANALYGIYASGIVNSQFGGTSASEGNYICGGGTAGIMLTGPGVSGNTFAQNRIGWQPNGMVSTYSMATGIYVSGGASGNNIGVNSTTGNMITHAGDGIMLWGSSTLPTALAGNTICGISGAAITLTSGANNSKSRPHISTATPSQIAGTAQAGDFVEVWLADRGVSYAGGSVRLLGTVTADGFGNWSIVPTGLTGWEFVTAMATDAGHNSSEFDNNNQVVPPATATRTITLTATITPTVTVTPTCTPTFTASPTGTPSTTATATLTVTLTATPTPTATGTRTSTVSPTVPVPTLTPRETATSTVNATTTRTATPNIPGTLTRTPTGVATTGRLLGVSAQAYPNPAMGTVRFLINTEGTAPVRVLLYNSNGEKAAEVSGVINGSGVLVWNSREVAPGIYLVRILANEKLLTKMRVAVIR